MLKKQHFIAILICNFIYSNDSSFDLNNLIEKGKAYFSIHVSVDGSSVAITNANYSQLYVANNGYFKNVDMKNINAFHCKWSPNGEKLMVMRSSFENRRRLNSLIVLNKYGNLDDIVVDFSSQRILPVGWTGNNTLHFLLDDQLITRNMNESENEWDLPLIFATKNKLYKKISDEKVQLLHQAQDMILNLSYSSDATLIVFEVYGNETIVIQDEKLKVINKQIKQIENLINEFSDFARMPKPMFKKHDIVNIVNENILLISQLDSSVNFKLNTFQKSINVNCDHEQFNRIFTNLFKNSIDSLNEKFSKNPDFQKKINIEILKKDDYIQIIIKDNGIGFGTKKLDDLLKPYYTTKKNGTGLGLPIVNKIINDHNGTLTLFENKSGAEIKINLPLYK